jgi:hypothetical protein
MNKLTTQSASLFFFLPMVKMGMALEENLFNSIIFFKFFIEKGSDIKKNKKHTVMCCGSD